MRRLLLLVMAGSLAMTAQSFATIARTPGLSPFVDRGAAEIAAETDRALARAATPARIEALLRAELARDQRNWLAIRGIESVAAERAVALPPDLPPVIAAAWAADNSLLARSTSCLGCAYDPASCALSAELICQAPMIATPLGDIAGLVKESLAYLDGGEVDEINLGLSLVGLGAAALVPASGGGSAGVKLGASTARLARAMGLVSPRLAGLATDAVRYGVDWARLPSARGTEDLARALRAERIAPLAAVLADLARMQDRLGLPATLHLLRHVDDASDARRIANAAEALGPARVGRIEVLGKARFLRATVRLSNLTIALLAGMAGLLASAGALLGSALGSVLGQLMRRALRRLARTA